MISRRECKVYVGIDFNQQGTCRGQPFNSPHCYLPPNHSFSLFLFLSILAMAGVIFPSLTNTIIPTLSVSVSTPFQPW